MCLATLEKPRIASKDITVYKILRSNLVSPYEYFQYKLGKTYKTKLTNSQEGNFFAPDDMEYYEDKNPTFYHEGFHSFLEESKTEKHRDYNEIVVRCVIPKGSKYVKNDLDYVVSEELQIVEVVS